MFTNLNVKLKDKQSDELINTRQNTLSKHLMYENCARSNAANFLNIIGHSGVLHAHQCEMLEKHSGKKLFSG